jgi:hypothetical protein
MSIYNKLLPFGMRRSIKNQILSIYQQRVMPTPGRIIVAGWQGSGSTFIYQVAGLLGLTVEKIHGQWHNERLEHVLFTIRDPRDIICNRAQRANNQLWQAGEHEQALLNSVDYFAAGTFMDDLEQSLARPNVTIIRYETFFGGREETLIRWLADQVMVPLDDEKLAAIMAETSIAANQARAGNFSDFAEFDQESQIHGRHITNRGRVGAWKIWFTPTVCAEAKTVLGQALIRLGYEKDHDWALDG